MSDEFILVPNLNEVLATRMPRYSFFGGSSRNGVSLGVQHPRITRAEAKKKLREKYGPSDYETGDGKVTFEYMFTNSQFPNVYFRIYDYKGYMSCGFGVPQDLELNQQNANELNAILTRLVTTVYLNEPPKEKEKDTHRRIKVKKKSEK